MGASPDTARPRQRGSDRRLLWDRRARMDRRTGPDRRRRDRRMASAGVAGERRAGMDRRQADRRAGMDRRQESSRRVGRRRRFDPTGWSEQELIAVRARFALKGPVACPSCGGAFTLGQGKQRGEQVARRVTCLGCGRSTVVPHSHVARIVIVDSQPARRDALRSVLIKAGHEVVETGGAAVALLACQAAPPDMVLVNVSATGRMDATSFIQWLRRQQPDTRVVAVAGRPSHGTADPLAVVSGLGAVETLRVPAAPTDVLEVVHKALRPSAPMVRRSGAILR